MNRTKLTPLGRLVFLVAILTTGAIVGAAGAAANRPHAQGWRCVMVRPGDTLWSLAGTLGGDDRRAEVQRLVDQNRLYSGALVAGSAIWVPAEGEAKALPAVDAARCPS